jgi:hypothetical protein
VKITLPILASAVVLTLALAGCSSGGLPAGSSTSAGNNGSGTSQNNGPTGSYSASDLVAILKKTEAARGLTGKINDNAQLKALATNGGTKSFTSEFAAAGESFQPKACGDLLDSLIAASEKELKSNDWRGASVVTTNDIISIAAASSASTTDSLLTDTKNIMSQLTSKCATMTIKAASISLGFTITPVTATTNADQTYAYEEDITSSGTVTKTLTIEAVYGNLYIGDVSITNPKLSDIEANVNAVIAASKS